MDVLCHECKAIVVMPDAHDAATVRDLAMDHALDQHGALLLSRNRVIGFVHLDGMADVMFSRLLVRGPAIRLTGRHPAPSP